MRPYKIKILLAGLLFMMFHQSCTNLEEETNDVLRTENFFQSDEEFVAALGNAYTSLYAFCQHNSYWATQEVMSDEMMIPQRGSDWFDGGRWLRAHRHEIDDNDENINNGWTFLYGGINVCNRLIFQFNDLVESGSVPAEDAAGFIAELRGLRALFYFWLLDAYGNVPLITNFDVPADFQPEQSSRTEVFNFIESELLEILPELTTDISGATYGRMQHYAAQTLLAKLYLNAEVYTGNERWQDALDACNEVINSGVYSLEGNYFANFNVENSTSSESIFAIPYDEINAQGFNFIVMSPHYQSQETFNLAVQPWNGYCTLQEFYESYEEGDVRLGEFGNQQVRSNFLAGPQFQADGSTPIRDPSASDADPDGPEVNLTPEINEHFPNALRQAGARIAKWEYESGSTENMNNDFAVFRYGDVLLMAAEAMWRMNPGSAEALALVNQIRDRSSAEPFTELTAENLLAERGREMFAEGWRRQDLIRFGVFSEPWEFKPEALSTETDELFPIPFNQIDANPNLQQNPGY